MKCIKCNEEKPLTDFYAVNTKWKIYRCKECERNRDNSRRRGFNTHKECLEKLGNKCKGCGITDSRVLQIDHVNGGGKQEILSYRSKGWRAYYKNVLADTTGKYQVLCANCNWIKKFENKEGLRK